MEPTREPLGEQELPRSADGGRRLAVRADDVDRGVGAPAARRARPAARASARARSRPRGHGLIASSHSTPSWCLAFEARRARGGSARASRARASTTSAGAFGDEALVREHPLGTRDLLAQPLDLGVARRRSPRARSGRTTAAKMRRSSSRAELDLHAAAPEDLRRLLHAVERDRRRRRSARPAPGHGDTIRRASRAGKLRPDLLGHVRHHGMEQREQPLERGERGRDRRRRRRS